MNAIINAEEIMRELPHRFPFLMVDRIIDIDKEEGRIVGLKNVSVNEWFFQGHFPEKKIMPGVLIVESLAQTGAVLLMRLIENAQSKLMYFMTIEKARFRKPVVPGDQLRLEVTLGRLRGSYCRMEGKALVNNELVADMVMSCAIIDKDRQ